MASDDQKRTSSRTSNGKKRTSSRTGSHSYQRERIGSAPIPFLVNDDNSRKTQAESGSSDEERVTGDNSDVDAKKGRTAENFGETPRERMILVILTIVYVVLLTLFSVMRKAMYDSFGSKYVFFRQLLTNFLYNVQCTIIVVGKLIWTNDITREQLHPRHYYKFALIALMDGGADLMASIGGVQTLGSWQTLLNQLLIPFIMALSFLFLRRRYHWTQVLSALLVIGGTALAIVPEFFKDSGSMVWYSVLLFAVSFVPQAGSYTAKEGMFKGKLNFDVFLLSCAVSWIQLVLTWVFMPIQMVPQFGGMNITEIPDIFKGGISCFAGIETTPIFNSTNDIIGYCSYYNTLITLGYSVLGFTAGIVGLFLMKRGSAALVALATAVSLPLSNLAFGIPGLFAVPDTITGWDVGGLVVVLVGFVLYRVHDVAKSNEKRFRQLCPESLQFLFLSRQRDSTSEEARQRLLGAAAESAPVDEVQTVNESGETIEYSPTARGRPKEIV